MFSSASYVAEYVICYWVMVRFSRPSRVNSFSRNTSFGGPSVMEDRIQFIRCTSAPEKGLQYS